MFVALENSNREDSVLSAIKCRILYCKKHAAVSKLGSTFEFYG